MGELLRLRTGLYRCPRCLEEYDCLRLRPEQLVCPECGEELCFLNPLQIWVRRYPDSLIVRKRPAKARR